MSSNRRQKSKKTEKGPGNALSDKEARSERYIDGGQVGTETRLKRWRKDLKT